MINSVIAIIKQENNILFLQRHSYDRTLPNVLCLPGGKVDGNETNDVALIREVFEETKLNLISSTFIGESIFTPKPEKVFKMNFYLGNADSYNVIISEEHSSYKWVDIDNIGNENIGQVTKQFLLNNLNKIK